MDIDTELLQNVGMMVGATGAGLFVLLLLLSLAVKRKAARRRVRAMSIVAFVIGAAGAGAWYYGFRGPALPPDFTSVYSEILGENLILTSTWAVERVYGRGMDPAIVARIEEALELGHTGNPAQGIHILESLFDQVDAPALQADLGTMYALIAYLDPALDNLREASRRSIALEHAMENLQKVDAWKAAQLAARQLEVEPNNDLLRPNEVPLGVPITSDITAGDMDGFAFRTPYGARDWYTVTVSNRFTELKPQLIVYYPDRREFRATSGNERRVTPGQDVSLEFILTEGARWYATVETLGGAGPYALTIQPQNAYDSFEPNEDWLAASPMGLEPEWDASILDPEDVDYFQFTVPDAGQVRVVLVNRSRDLQPHLAVYNPQNREVARTRSYAPQVPPGRNVTLPFTATDSLAYHVAVRSLGGSGDYTLRIEGR